MLKINLIKFIISLFLDLDFFRVSTNLYLSYKLYIIYLDSLLTNTVTITKKTQTILLNIVTLYRKSNDSVR